MTVAFRAATSTGISTNTTSKAPAVPAGAANLDVAVVFLAQWDASSGGGTPAVTPPAGFTKKDTWTSGDGLAKNSVWWKRLSGADTGNYTFSWDIGAYTTAEVMLFSGCIATGDPFDGTPVKNAGSYGTFGTLTVVTTDAAGALVWGCYNDNGGTHTPPTSFTEAIDDDCASCAYRIPGSSGSLAAASASVDGTGASSSGSWLGALLSASGGGAGAPVFPPPVISQYGGFH